MKHCSQCRSLLADHVQLCPQDETPLRFVEDVEPGMIIRGKYRIVARIGAGGMATVFRARHELLNEDRAIKLVLLKYSSDKDFLKRFRHEAAVARKLRHENAVWVEDLDQIEDGRPFIAMELLEGCDLRALIQKEGPLSVERILRLSAQVASALDAAHELGIVHRDIKPDNIFVTCGRNGVETAKVLDFGIAKALDGTVAGPAYTATRAGLIIGTPQYIAPERALAGPADKPDGRADIYSLGLVIYEMLTGRLPFESDTPMGMLQHHLHTQPLPPHLLCPDLHIPAPVSMVLMKALEKNPANRFQTAKAMFEALQHPVGLAAETSRPMHDEVLPAGEPPMTATAVLASSSQGTKVAPEVIARVPAEPEASLPTPAAAFRPPARRALLWTVPALLALAALAVLLLFKPSFLFGPATPPDKPKQDGAPPASAQIEPVPSVEKTGPPRPGHKTIDKAAADSHANEPARAGQERAAAVRKLLDTANSQRDNGRYRDAIKTYEDALKRDPGNKEAQAGLASALVSRGSAYYNGSDFTHASEDFDRAVKLQPDAHVYELLGVALEKTGQWDRAIKNYDESIRLRRDFRVFFARGVAYDHQGNYKAAIQDFNETESLNPKPDVLFFQTRAQTYYKSGQPDLGKRDFEHASALKQPK